MTSRTEFIVELEDPPDSTESTRKIGFFARRRNRKRVRARKVELKEPIERVESAAERVAKGRHPGRQGHTSLTVPQSNSPSKAATRSKSPDLVGNGPRRVDLEARRELREIPGRREFLRQSAVGAGILALGAGLGYGSGYGQAQGLSGNTRTVITDNEIAARVIGGVRIATEFIPDPVPAGTDLDPYPGSAIQAALNDGLHVYVPAGTWRLTSTILRAVDGATIIGAGKSTKLVFNGVSQCISAGSQTGWLVANLAVDAGGVNVSSATESRISEIWVNGILTDNRPIGSGGGGTAGYYGVRAADFITSGDGSPSNPYNASAIQNAINALPSQGGVVFIKAGVWRGTSRITVNAAGTERTKRVVFRGESSVWHQVYFHDSANNDSARAGAHVQAGFDTYVPCDFYDLEISPHPNNFGSQPCIDFIVDPTKGNSDYEWTGGHTVRRCRLFRGSHGIRYRGVNMGAVFWQIWGVVIEDCGFIKCTQGVRIDRTDADSTAPSQGIRMILRNNEFRACAGRAFNFDVSSSRLEFSNTMLEGCGAVGGDYAFWVNTYGDGGVLIYNVDFGDGTYSNKVAKIFIGRSGYVNGIFPSSRTDTPTALPEIDIGGRGIFRIAGRDPGSKFNLVNAIQMTIEEVPDNGNFTLGAVDGASQANAADICIRPHTTPRGFIGTRAPGPSPYTYTNLDMYEEMVYLVGGAITDVARNGQSIGQERSHYLRPGDSMVISYTTAPTIKRFGVSI